MSIRRGNVILAGAGGSANPDEVTINLNSSDKLQALGTINKNLSSDTSAIYNWIGTLEEYNTQNVETLHPEWVCYITDDSDPANSTTGIEIGDIGIAAFGIDETQNLRRYLNGQVISQTQFQSFTDKIKSVSATYSNIVTTEENWQAEVTNSALGQCGKFVIDDVAGTIRLPKVVNINGLQNLALLGGIKAESLPNITGSVEQINSGSLNSTKSNGALEVSRISTSGGHNTGSENGWSRISLNASDYSSTYQDNAPVQQEAVQYPYFIQVATGVETSIDVSREIELNNPFSLLDYKYSEYELSNASWLLSNGQWNSGAVYQSVYDLLLQELNGTSSKLPYRSYVNTVGNIVNADGVLSGFSASDYAELPEIFDGNAPWERVLKFTTGNVTTAQVIWGNNGDYRGFQVYIRTDGKFTMSGSSDNSTWNLFDVTSTTALTANTTYYLRVIYDGNKYTQEISTDGINYNLEGTANVTTPVTTTTIRLGTHGGAPFSGTIDLNESYININGERWWTGRRKIITSVGDYTDTDFVINTTDTTFRLPLKVALASGKAVVGNGYGLGLICGSDYDNKHQIRYLSETSADYPAAGGIVTSPIKQGEAYSPSGGGFSDGHVIGISGVPELSGIETSANGLYLYFYVGETVQDANLINAGQMSTLVSQLKECHVVIETYQNGNSWYRLYDDGWCEQGSLVYTGASNAGQHVITFLKPFTNNVYNFLWEELHNGNGADSTGCEVYTSRTASSTVLYLKGGFCGYGWQACGYAARENA